MSASKQKRFFNLPNRRADLPFNDAVQLGQTLYVSGRIGFRPGTSQVPDDPSEEARYMLDGVRDVLAQAGMGMNDLVNVQIFCSDISLFNTFNTVYKQYFTGDLPARAFIGSGPLLFGAKFEIVGMAVRAE